MENIAIEGLYYSLWIINRLQEVSGDWDTVGRGELLNFEDIFENDREIIVEKLKQNQKSEKAYINGTYEDLLYNFLTEFMEFPKETRKILSVIVGFMLNLYDLVLKNDEKNIMDEKRKIEELEEEGV